VNDEVHSITEFHGTGRGRYMTRQRYTDAANFILPGTTRWSDYDDDVIYSDYVVDEITGDITNTTAYLPGIAQMDSATGNVMYLHTDQIGSLRAVSTEYGEPIQRIVYTAFGETVHEDGTVGTRYQYAGAWGYQTSNADDPLSNNGLLHVGHRYYNPSTGRFLQRDPIGIWGGLNVYEYVSSSPTVAVDPDGLVMIIAFGGFGCAPSSNLQIYQVPDHVHPEYVLDKNYKDRLRDEEEQDRKNKVRGYIPWYAKIWYDIVTVSPITGQIIPSGPVWLWRQAPRDPRLPAT